MLTVQREVADQRRHRRSHTPLGMLLSGTSYVVRDWSLGGFRLEGFHGNVAVGDQVVVQFMVPYQGLEVSFTTEAVIVRSSEGERIIAGTFLHLGERERELLRHVMHG